MPTDLPENQRGEFGGKSKPPIRSGVGFDFAGAVAGLTLVGYVFDRYQDTAPWGLLIGACLGIVGGLYNSLKAAGVFDRKGEDRDRS